MGGSIISPMQEEQIAQKLQQNITAQPYAPPTPAGPPDGDSAFQSSVSLGDPVISTRLHDYFELPRADKYSEERQHQLKVVLEWAVAHAQSNELINILTTLQQKELELGNKPFADRLQRLYRLAKIEAQSNFLDIERRQLYGA